MNINSIRPTVGEILEVARLFGPQDTRRSQLIGLILKDPSLVAEFDHFCQPLGEEKDT